MQSTVQLGDAVASRRRDPLVLLLQGLARRPRLHALIFHRVLSAPDPLRSTEPTAAEFEARMRWVAANFDVLTLGEAAQALARDRLPARAACITFDDGYADNFEVALPILRRLGLRATFFVATGYLDGGCMFNDIVIEAVRDAPGRVLDLESLGLGFHVIASEADRLLAIGAILRGMKGMATDRRQALALSIAARVATEPPTHLMMTSEQVARMHGAGMEIGAHTVSHPILAQVSIDAARREIGEGRVQLEHIIGAPVRVFAYPNGKPGRDYRCEHVALVRDLGFDCAVSTAWGAARAGADLYQIPRFTPWDRTNAKFALRLFGNSMRSRYELA